jgi:hypothetical protein
VPNSTNLANQVEVDDGDDESGESRLVREGTVTNYDEGLDRSMLRKTEKKKKRKLKVHFLVDCSSRPAKRSGGTTCEWRVDQCREA